MVVLFSKVEAILAESAYVILEQRVIQLCNSH